MFDIHTDIRQAETPPGSFYCDPAIHDQIVDRVLRPSWQMVADATQVRLPQHVVPVTFLEGSVDEPLLITRDSDDVLRCMSNVCTHRANLVCSQPAKAAHLRCPYHGRRFGLDGRLQHMPEFEDVCDFPREADHLTQVRLESLGPFLFAATDPAFSFDTLIQDVRRRTGFLPIDQCRFDASRSRDYLVQANWMLYCDNYLEGFHIPFVHASLNAVLDYGDYRTELFDRSSLQIGITSSGEDTFSLPDDSPDAGLDVAAYYYWLFPNIMLNVYPWGISINVVRPLAVDRTRISFLCYVWDEARLDQGAGSDLDRVEREDEEVVESVQRGLRSRLYTRGRYSPNREQAVHHFHRMLAGSLIDA